jgi:hypothetical protein
VRRMDLFNLPVLPATRCLGITQPLTEMNSGYDPRGGGKVWRALKADNLTAVCEPIVWKMWEPQHLTTVWRLWPVKWIALLYFTFTLYHLVHGYQRFSSRYAARLRAHTNELIITLTVPPTNRRLRRYWPNDLVNRF